MRLNKHILILAMSMMPLATWGAVEPDTLAVSDIEVLDEVVTVADSVDVVDIESVFDLQLETPSVTRRANNGRPLTIYAQPASWTLSDPWWHGLWINTAVLSGAFIGTLIVLECLPEDATSWNRAELRAVPFYRRWFNNIFKRGPEWDHDNVIFNYVLHPYAGAAYFMAARTCGFNFWQSMLYCACVSTIGWEFGIEACMERPSIQDIFITPIVGSLMGEGCYRAKRAIVNNDYRLLGSTFVGHLACVFLDPLNEFIGIFDRKRCRSLGPGCITSSPTMLVDPATSSTTLGITVTATF